MSMLERMTRTSKSSRHTLTERYFADIQTDEQAYWLGFISADGNVSRSLGQLTLSLGVADADHVQRWLTAMGSSSAPFDHRFRRRLPQGGESECRCRTASVCSRVLVADLVALGVTPRKSLTLRPWAGPAHLLGAYYRGLIDGDGSILSYPPKIRALVILSGTAAVVDSFCRWAASVSGAPLKTPFQRRGCEIREVRFSAIRQTQTILTELYRGATAWLPRKRAVADAILQIIPRR